MSSDNQINSLEIERLYESLVKDATVSGYFLNPDREFTKALLESLIINQNRYGYPSCPCRLSTGNKFDDLDIICPCYYRDQDIIEHGACYCALYVSKAVAEGKKNVAPIPERRSAEDEKRKCIRYPVWRCSVCGYLCARANPPEVCPICKAKHERFERFVWAWPGR